METLMVTFCNAAAPDREEEMNNWYTWVHIRDVMFMGGSMAVQRFELADAQPKNPDIRRKYLTLYEVVDKELCTKMHMEWTKARKLDVSSSFDLTTFAEAYWDPVCGTAPFSAYADYSGDKSVLIVRMDGDKVEKILTKALLTELAAKPGVKSVNLLHYGKDQMPTSAAKTETVSNMLVAQLDSSHLAAQSWDDFAKEKKLAALQPQPIIYRPIIDRFVAGEAIKSPEWRAISYLSHAILDTSAKTPIFGGKKWE
jgi:hypothetical protein